MLRLTSRSFRVFASAAVVVCVASPFAHSATVTGRVLDSTTSLPLAGVEVLIDGVDSGAKTDLSGQFSAEVGEGERLFTFRRTGFSEQSVGPLALAAEGEATVPDAKLTPVSANEEVVMLETLTVQGEAVKNSVVTDRQQAAISVDLISAADFSKFTGSDVADIVVRIPGLSTTSQGSFAVVRGLAERYNPVMLDGIVLPSSDPERQSPQLDIFPSRLVDAIVVSKTYEPRLPATSSGGAIDLRTKPLPESRVAQIQFGFRFDEGFLNGDDFYTYGTQGDWDYLAYGKKDRPESPTGTPAQQNSAFLNGLSGNPGATVPKSVDFPVGVRFSVDFQDRIELNDEGRALGVIVSYGYETTYSSEEGRRTDTSSDYSIFDSPATITSGDIARYELGFRGEDYAEYEEEVRQGLYTAVGYAFNQRNSISLSAFVSQIGIDEVTRVSNGFRTEDSNSNATYANIQRLQGQFDSGNVDPAFLDSLTDEPRLSYREELYYLQRNLTNLSLSGEHTFDEGIDSRLTWALAWVQARQDEPSFSIFPYQQNVVTGVYIQDYGNGARNNSAFWRETEEISVVGRFDYERKFDFHAVEDIELRTGYYQDSTERSFNSTSFGLTSLSPLTLTATSPAALADAVGAVLSSPTAGSTFQVGPFPSRAESERDLRATYLSFDIPLLTDRPNIHRLSLLGGARLESFEMESTGSAQIDSANDTHSFYTLLGIQRADRVYNSRVDEDTVHPVLALNYSPVARTNLRASYSETIARPSFREIGSYFSTDDVTGNLIHGNYTLQTSKVYNYDLRAERFFANSKDMVAVSVFAKTIRRPIERLTIEPSFGATSTFFNNPDDAELTGLELESAKNLAFLGDLGSYFTVGGNYTRIEATVDRHPTYEARQIDSEFIADERRLFDQPEWIANAYVTFDHESIGFSTTLSYFAISDVLQTVNISRYDTYVASYGRLDLSVSQRINKQWQLRVSARNLTDPKREFIADPYSTSREFVTRSYRDGRSYTVSAVCDF
ncbi:MAG: TonB-dependent receptor [Burkholderiales bacterium]|nr:TonB-dependent receptor [Opitutaceae bacterium]